MVEEDGSTEQGGQPDRAQHVVEGDGSTEQGGQKMQLFKKMVRSKCRVLIHEGVV